MGIQRAFITAITAFTMLATVSCSDDKDGDKTDSGDGKHQERVDVKVIYGDDDRLDLYQVRDNSLKQLADSTVALMRSSDVVPQSNGTALIRGDNYGSSYNLCAEEPFRDQDSAAFCSGSLVGPDLVMTAGHCIRYSSDCSTTRFVFGYAIHDQNSGSPTSVPLSNVYSCSQVIHSEVAGNGADFAIVRLDRPVTDHAPLAVRRQGLLTVGEPLVVIGHPAGLPTKVAGGATVRSIASKYFIASLDTYGGNSGSAVFNARTRAIEGILVRGETDFVSRGFCRISNRCEQEGCRGEDVTLVSEVLRFIPASNPDPETPPANNEEISYEKVENLGIPDNNKTGITSELTAHEAPQGRAVKVEVEIAHTWIGDLEISLIAPNGTTKVLHRRAGGSSDNINGTYGAELQSADDLSDLSSLTTLGTWKLKIVDRAKRDEGKLIRWALRFE